MKCGKCGKEIDNGARFCDACGTIVSQVGVQNGVILPSQKYGGNNGAAVRYGFEAPKVITVRKTFKELKADAREQIKGNILRLFVIGLVWGIVTALYSFPTIMDYLPEELKGDIKISLEVFSLLSLVSMVLSIIAPGLMQWGDTTNLSRMFTGEKAQIRVGLFAGFKNFGAAVVTALLVMIYTVLWSMLFLIPGLVKAYSYACAIYIRQENPSKSANDCITESREMMVGHKFRLFCYSLWFALLYIASIFTLFIALIWIAPYSAQVRYNFYQNIKKLGLEQNTQV
ncbi:MAG: DUF975 family protein [Christensenellaceae bacterium]|jgi:uncharacterized membrane protein|nr:DUF975 family protein [Christensenellaceae bacterium]